MSVVLMSGVFSAIDGFLREVVALAPFVPGAVVDLPAGLADPLKMESQDRRGDPRSAGRDHGLLRIDALGCEQLAEGIGGNEAAFVARDEELRPRNVDRAG